MKRSSKTLQNLPYFWNMKTRIVFFVFHFVQKKLGGFLYSKNIANFEVFKLEHFIKHKPLISEE